jgi:sulfatase maturation enzyme AslB (radical SAM superfamily)
MQIINEISCPKCGSSNILSDDLECFNCGHEWINIDYILGKLKNNGWYISLENKREIELIRDTPEW